MGISVGKDVRGLNFIGHGGGIAGFVSEAVWYPDAQDMVVAVTQTPQGVAFSVNGSPPRVLPWVEGLTFRQGNTFLTFRQNGNGGAATELRFDAGGGYYTLKRQ